MRRPGGDDLSRCFPFASAPELSSERSWYSRRQAGPEQSARLQHYLKHDDVGAVGWQRCAAAASALGVPYEAVVVWVRERKASARARAFKVGKGA